MCIQRMGDIFVDALYKSMFYLLTAVEKAPAGYVLAQG